MSVEIKQKIVMKQNSPSKSPISKTTKKVTKTPSPKKNVKKSLIKYLASPPKTETKAKTPSKSESKAHNEHQSSKTAIPKKKLIQNLIQLDQEIINSTQDNSKNISPKKKTKNQLSPIKDFSYRPPSNTVFDLQEYLDDLQARQIDEDLHDSDYKFLKKQILQSKKAVVVTGAGISVASGIPDFRSQEGIFKQIKEKTNSENNDISMGTGKDMFDFNFIYSSPKALSLFNDMIFDLHKKIKNTQNTAFHGFIDNLAKKKKLKRCYTQNIDGFETHLDNLVIKHPISLKKKEWPNVIQLHGSINHLHCIKCRKIFDIEDKHFEGQINKKEGSDSLDYFIGEDNTVQISDLLPDCPECAEAESVRIVAGKRPQGVGKLRSNIILYNEEHPESEGIGRVVESDILTNSDLLIICGTTLKIPGVKRIVKEFSKSIESKKQETGEGGAIIWLGNEIPSQSIVDYVEYIDLVVLGDCQKFAKMTEKWFE